jgi:hypothetical protein
MYDKTYTVLMVLGWILLGLMGLVAVIGVVNYFIYNSQIDSGELIKVDADITYYDFNFMERKDYYVSHDDVKYNYFECDVEFEYSVDGELYEQFSETCLSANYRMDFYVYYKANNPDYYVFRKSVEPTVFIRLIWPLIGAGIIYFTKKKYYYY